MGAQEDVDAVGGLPEQNEGRSVHEGHQRNPTLFNKCRLRRQETRGDWKTRTNYTSTD